MKNLKKNSEIIKRWILVGLSLFILAISIAFIALSFGYADDGYGTNISFNMDYVVFLLCGIAMLCYSIYSVIGYYKNKNLKMVYYSAFGVISVLLAFYPLGVFFKAMSKHKEEFGHGSVEGIAAAEAANNAVTGATLIPLLTMGIPGDGTVAIMLSALMINGLNPGLSLFTTQGDIMYAIMIGLIFVNLFMLLQGSFLTKLFAKVVSIPQEILTPIIVLFCFAGAYSVNKNYFDVGVALVFAIIAWLLRKLDMPPVPILLGMVLGNMTETNFRRALLISNGNPTIFVSSIYCIIFVVLIVLAVSTLIRSKMKEAKAEGKK